MDIFKEYDIRGVYPEEIDEDKAFKIGRAIGSYLHGEKIFVNHDTRLGSIRIRNEFVSGLMLSGAAVFELGMNPITVAAFASFSEKCYGVSITASHNPPEYTGILVYHKGIGVSPTQTKKAFLSGGFKEKLGRLIPSNYQQEYIDYITKDVGKLDLKVGFDGMGGATTFIFPRMLTDLHSKVFSVHDKVSQNFFGKTPEPTKTNSDSLGRLIRKEKLDLGFQLDGDGDRMIVRDERGRFIDPMTTAAIFVKNLKFKKILATVSCSPMLEKYAKVTYTKVGRPFIEVPLGRKGHDFGVETSSHFYFGSYYPFSDGLLASLLMLKIVRDSGVKLSELAEEIPKIYYGNYNLKYGSEKLREASMKRIIKSSSKLGKVNKLDGIRIDTEDGFMLFRKSNTEPIIRAYYEGNNYKSMARLKKLMNKVLKYGR